MCLGCCNLDAESNSHLPTGFLLHKGSCWSRARLQEEKQGLSFWECRETRGPDLPGEMGTAAGGENVLWSVGK